MRTQFRRDHGAAIPLVALLLPVLILMVAFAVDLGRQRDARRSAQGDADIIALDLVRLANGRDLNDILSGTDSPLLSDAGAPLDATTAVAESAARNDIDVADVEVDWGSFTPGGTFQSMLHDYDLVPNAVQVTTHGSVDYSFQPGNGDVTRSAVARNEAQAGFSIGSFAASLDTGSGPLLNSLVGDALGLGVLSYDGLAALDFDWLDIATELGLGTPEELFTTDVDAIDVIEAAADILRRDDPSSAHLAVLDAITADAENSVLADVTVAQVITVATGAEDAAASAGVNLFNFLTTAAFIANGDSGVSLPATELNLPGTDVSGSLNLIQKPRDYWGYVGEGTTTSQTDLNATFTLGTADIGNRIVSTLDSIVPGICGLLLLGPLLCGLTSEFVQVRLVGTIDLDLASATGTIARIACQEGFDELDIDVRSDLVTSDLSIAAEIIVGGDLAGTVPLSVSAGGGDANGSVEFDIPPDVYGEYVPVNPGSGSLGLDSAEILGTASLGSLFTASVEVLLEDTLSSLNSAVILPLSGIMGLRVAGADVAPLGVNCTTPQLVG